MTDQEYKSTKKSIIGYYKKWYLRLGLRHWDISLDIPRGLGSGVAGSKYCEHANCEANWEYMSASITFYAESNLKLTPRQLEETVVHELCHVVVCEMRYGGEVETVIAGEMTKHEERVVTMMTNALMFTADDEGKLNGRTQTRNKEVPAVPDREIVPEKE